MWATVETVCAKVAREFGGKRYVRERCSRCCKKVLEVLQEYGGKKTKLVQRGKYIVAGSESGCVQKIKVRDIWSHIVCI